MNGVDGKKYVKIRYVEETARLCDWASLNPSGIKTLSTLIVDFSDKGAEMVQSLLGTYRVYSFLSYQTIVAAVAFVVAGVVRRRSQMFDRAVVAALVALISILGTICVIRPLLVILHESLDVIQANDGSRSETPLTGMVLVLVISLVGGEHTQKTDYYTV